MDSLNPDNRTEMQKAKDVIENPYNGAHYLGEALTETLSMYNEEEMADLVREIYASSEGGKGYNLKRFLDEVAAYMQDNVYVDMMEK